MTEDITEDIAVPSQADLNGSTKWKHQVEAPSGRSATVGDARGAKGTEGRHRGDYRGNLG